MDIYRVIYISKGLKILIVDDNESITTPLKMIIDQRGHECTVVNTGRQGFNLINEQEWDTIVLDLAMPEVTGMDILDKLEKEGKIKDKKIIVFTAVSLTDTELMKLTDRGVFSCIRKPVNVEVIIKKLGI